MNWGFHFCYRQMLGNGFVQLGKMLLDQAVHLHLDNFWKIKNPEFAVLAENKAS